MRKTFLWLFAMALAPACVFAVDGVTLINQSTIMAAGGFPYVISQPGSYRLSGPLTLTTTPNGNDGTLGDVVIAIAGNNITLDLDGFTINVVNNITHLGHTVRAIFGGGGVVGTTVRNGNITFSGTGSIDQFKFASMIGIDVQFAQANRLEDLTILVFNGIGFKATEGLLAGNSSVIRHIITDSNAVIACPSLIVDTVGISPNGAPCVESNLAPFL